MWIHSGVQCVTQCDVISGPCSAVDDLTRHELQQASCRSRTDTALRSVAMKHPCTEVLLPRVGST